MTKGKNKKIDLEELFSSVLEQSEVVPGSQVRDQLMRKLARKEFVRFNPSRFNIYYLGGIIAAGIITTILMITGQDPAPVTKPFDNKTITIPADTPVVASETDTIKEPLPGLSNVAGEPENRKEAFDHVPDNQGTVQNNDAIVTKSGRPGLADLPDSAITKTLVMDNLSDAGNNVTLHRNTFASFVASGTSGCVPLKVTFTNNSQVYDSCRWIFGDGGSSDEVEPEWIFDKDGEFRVTLTVYGKQGSQETATAIITVFPQPEARFEFYPENPIIPDDAIRFMNYSMEAVKYTWDFGDGLSSETFEPDHKYDKYGSYDVRLIVWSDHGCSDSLTIHDAFAGSGCYVEFPNAFIPNPDGPSDGYYTAKSDEGAQIFHPATSGVSEFQMSIFSKNGILIFESNDINVGWDGYHKGQLCESGVYIWKVRGTYKNGEPFVKMGDVTLLKR